MKSIKFKYFFIFLSLFLIALSGCSVVMAGRTKGTSVKELSSSRFRSSVLSNDGVEITKTEKNEEVDIIYEEYLVQKPEGSAWRAVMHGILDVSTLGLWEVVGTPVEMHIGKNVYYPVRIYYTKDEEVEKIVFIQ